MNLSYIFLLFFFCLSVFAQQEKSESSISEKQKLKQKGESSKAVLEKSNILSSSSEEESFKKPTASNLNPLSDLSENSTAQSSLREVLKDYQLKAIQIKVEQEIFLSAVQSSIKSQGFLNLKGEKFRLELKGNPSSLLLFDGEFLWYQADKEEKTVFRLKEHPQIQLLTGFFSEKNFFKSFHIKKTRRQRQDYILQLEIKKEIEGLSEIFIKVSSYISEVRLIWKDLNNWQKYKFSKPLYKELSDKFFQFNPTGFKVITKI